MTDTPVRRLNGLSQSSHPPRIRVILDMYPLENRAQRDPLCQSGRCGPYAESDIPERPMIRVSPSKLEGNTAKDEA